MLESVEKIFRQNPPRPTDAELEILNVLWQRGPSTVLEVQEVMSENKPTGYTTALKMLQIMMVKGLVERDEKQKAHVYKARLAQEQTQRQIVTDVLNRVFNGSASRLVMQALTSERTSAEELSKIRQVLDELDGGAR